MPAWARNGGTCSSRADGWWARPFTRKDIGSHTDTPVLEWACGVCARGTSV